MKNPQKKIVSLREYKERKGTAAISRGPGPIPKRSPLDELNQELAKRDKVITDMFNDLDRQIEILYKRQDKLLDLIKNIIKEIK